MKTQPIVFCAALWPLLFAMPSAAAPQTRGNVTIINTGDRLTPGYQATVAPDGKISVTLVPRRGQKEIHRTNLMIPPIRERFFADLQKAEPLQKLSTGTPSTAGGRDVRGRYGRREFRGQQTPAAAARHPLSSRPEIFVRYQGALSPNLRTVNSAAGRVFYQDVKQVLQVLRLPIPNFP